MCIFFFSSRRRHTRLTCDWSSDVCSSDLEEVEAAVYAHDSRDVPDRDRAADVAAADRVLTEGISGLDVARELDRRGFGEVADAILAMQRQRVAADYLQTSAIIDEGGNVTAAINDPNRYTGPGTGYRLDGERWQRLQHLPHEVDARALESGGAPVGDVVAEQSVATAETEPDDVVVAVGPAFADGLRATIGGLAHRD